jgi:hypothetical protein
VVEPGQEPSFSLPHQPFSEQKSSGRSPDASEVQAFEMVNGGERPFPPSGEISGPQLLKMEDIVALSDCQVKVAS